VKKGVRIIFKIIFGVGAGFFKPGTGVESK